MTGYDVILVQQHVSRGKLDVFVTIDSSQAADTVLRVNEPLLRAYIDTLNTLAVRYDLKNDMSLMSLMWPCCHGSVRLEILLCALASSRLCVERRRVRSTCEQSS